MKEPLVLPLLAGRASQGTQDQRNYLLVSLLYQLVTPLTSE
nr:MAG TPA: hypothetical protein [Caudoviricetes sp.]DAN21250.1 MAG TPA_asm: hypothetical protein [Bacteriophage sp.]